MAFEDFQKTRLQLSISSITEPEDKDIDLLWSKFILCHEKDNLNQDYFTSEILNESYATIQNKPINWQHGQPVIGHVVDSTVIHNENERDYIEAAGYLYRYIYPNLINQIVEDYENNDCRVSMECYFKDAEFWVGQGDNKKVYNWEEAESLGILDHVGGTYEGKPVYRVFKSPLIFGGVGIVSNPADTEAWMLKIASEQFNNPDELQEIFKNVSNEHLNKVLHNLLHLQYEERNYANIPNDLIVQIHSYLH